MKVNHFGKKNPNSSQTKQLLIICRRKKEAGSKWPISFAQNETRYGQLSLSKYLSFSGKPETVFRKKKLIKSPTATQDLVNSQIIFTFCCVVLNQDRQNTHYIEMITNLT